MTENVTADTVKLRVVLSEKGLPSKLGARFTQMDMKVHSILCSAYDFATGLVVLEIPDTVFKQLSREFSKVWMHRVDPKKAEPGKTGYFFGLTDAGIKITIRTALTKDHGIFDSKANQVVLPPSWAKYLQKKTPTGGGNVDWSQAERAAERYNKQVVKNINDGKTFNAHKDNPWARKNLKKKNDQ